MHESVSLSREIRAEPLTYAAGAGLWLSLTVERGAVRVGDRLRWGDGALSEVTDVCAGNTVDVLLLAREEPTQPVPEPDLEAQVVELRAQLAEVRAEVASIRGGLEETPERN